MTQVQFTIPGGHEKGTPIGDASDGSLDFWSRKISDGLAADPDGKYAAKDKRLLAAMKAEVARRKGGGTSAAPKTTTTANATVTPPRTPSTALAKSAATALAGSYRDPGQVTALLEQAAQNYNLVSPATSVGVLPEGTSVALSLVTVDVKNETYNVNGKRGLSKVVLDKVAAAMGISWLPHYCYRADDGSDPHYVNFKVAGFYRAFDGHQQLLIAEKQMDLRDGSPTCVELAAQARKDDRSPDNQIRQMRHFILEHAESKAKNRAIRSMGLRTSYEPKELEKPFVCARIMFTGQSEDPVLKHQFAGQIADSFLNASNNLYGGQPPQPQSQSRALPHGGPSAAHQAHLPARAPNAPPPVGAIPADVDDVDDRYDVDMQPDLLAEVNASTAQTTVPGEFTIPAGKSKGTKLADATDADLDFWATKIGAELDNETSRDPDADGALHGALLDEIKRRESKLKGTPKQAEFAT